MKISWECDDGYVGGKRPQSFQLDDEEILSCGDVDAAMNLIEDQIEEDFRQRCNPMYEIEDIRKDVEQLFKDNPGNPDE